MGALCGDLDLSKVRGGKYTTREGLLLYSPSVLIIQTYSSLSSSVSLILSLYPQITYGPWIKFGRNFNKRGSGWLLSMVVDWREVDVADYCHFLPKPHDRDDLSDHDHCRFLHSSKFVCVIRPMILESASHTGGYPDIFLPFRHFLKPF